MTDKELLELAAKAADIGYYAGMFADAYQAPKEWSPLTDDGDALRLAVKLRMDVTFNELDVFAFPANGSDGESETINVDDPYAATRRAIVRAAAAIGKEMP